MRQSGASASPSLQLPATVKDLKAERVGGRVVLRWTSPDKTTDKLPIKGTATAVVCREVTPPVEAVKPGAPVCVPVARLTLTTGEMQAADDLPPALVSDPVRLLSYRVTVANAVGRSGAASVPAFAAAGMVPQPVVALRVKVVGEGTVVEWQPIAAATAETDVVELTRVDPALAAKNAAQTAAAKDSKAASAPSTPRSRLQLTPKKGSSSGLPKNAQAAEIYLRAGESDSGGTVDHTAVNGETYVYTAQRVRSVTVAGHELQLRSAASAGATVAVRDTFPPAVPSGLAAVPNVAPGGASPNAERQGTSIDLSWEPDTDADLAGYIVYRRDLSAGGTAVRLTATPIVEAAFRDSTAVAGVRYSYTVTAVDTSGNESKASAAAEESLRK